MLHWENAKGRYIEGHVYLCVDKRYTPVPSKPIIAKYTYTVVHLSHSPAQATWTSTYQAASHQELRYILLCPGHYSHYKN